MVGLEDGLPDYDVVRVVAACGPEAQGVWSKGLGDVAVCLLFGFDL